MQPVRPGPVPQGTAARPWRRRRAAARLWPTAAAALLLMRGGEACAAAFAPVGVDPAADAVETIAPPAERPGLRWGLAPIRIAGSLALDGRWQRLEDGRRQQQTLSYAELDWATHVWEPWFIQLRGGFGALVGQDVAHESDGARSRSRSTAGTGHFALAVFPQSRFPFELRADVSDSRTRGDHVGNDYRLQRLSLNQSWRPESGADSYNLNLERSRLETFTGVVDTVSALRADAFQQRDAHRFEWSGQLSRNSRSDTADRSGFSALTGRHAYVPLGALQVDTLATWNEVRLRSGAAAARQDSSTDIRQISSVATWRPREGEWLYSAEQPLQLTGSARLIDSGTETRTGDSTLLSRQRLRAANLAAGLSQELSPAWRWAAGGSATRIEPMDGATSTLETGNVSLGYTPLGLMLGAWRYTPGAAANLGLVRSSETGLRHTQGLQLSQGLGRDWQRGNNASLSLQLTQSLGALHDSQTRSWVNAVAHTLGAYWQASELPDADGRGLPSQSYASLSLSDSRTLGRTGGRFQLANLQFSRRTTLSRHASWSGNLTAQASRADSAQIDAFTGQVRDTGLGWQPYYSGSLSYEHLRLWDVPRLRYTLVLMVHSQVFESRAAGDIDALHERVTESIENRLDYNVGRLELRLLARAARVEGREVGLIGARALRRF